ncbi:MAG: DUF5916 domain-containing protein [Candidatus Aminicenantaceae bacterium]
MKKNIAFILLLLIPVLLFALKSNNKPQEQKVVRAVRALETVEIDGVLKEEVWQEEGYSGFTQSDPIDGEEPTEKTIVWVAYNDKELYIAARLYDTEPESIVQRLGRRDDFLDSDWFIFAVDPYYDRRSGFQFAVNPAGSIVDWTLYNDEWNDDTWDGVWEWSARIDDEGWVVEIKIPYNQLRFPQKDEYVWGVNFRRIIKRKNERVAFVWVSKEDRGYVSRFAKLIGIRDIHPGRHIEFMPYSVSQAKYSPEESGNPFQTGREYLANTGFDLKIGIKSNLTLDATLNPDFGQVEVDPAVINLSAYETYYSEKRPFFIEGSSMFNAFGKGGATDNININWSSPRFFYSRRIGRTPQGGVTQDEYVNYPDRTTILGAMKLTGKVNGWNVGFINALTAREYAEIDYKGERWNEEVEPFSYYGVLRGQKEFNEGAQGLGFMTTSVVRDLRTESLESILNRRAFALGIDGWTFLDKDRKWVISGWIGGTRVEGSKENILELQRSSIHYFQRPDATHVEVDEEATSLSGWAGRFMVNKQKGNFLFNMALGALSPGFNPNDVGFQWDSSDIINGHLLAGYQWPHPGKVFRSWWLIGGPFRTYDFGGNKNWDGYLIGFNAQFLNYWGIDTMFAYNPHTWSNGLTRGGPLVRIPPGKQYDFGIYSDSRKPIVISMYTSYYSRPSSGHSWYGDFSLRWKLRSNLSVSFGPSYNVRKSIIQWVTGVDDTLMAETYGTRYIFGDIEQKTVSGSIRLNWTFTPKLTLQLYLQPFIAVGKYERFKELAKPKGFDFNVFGEGQSTISYEEEMYTVDPDGPGPAESFSFENPDFNYKSLRGTAVLRWEYLPGSTLYFVWTQSRADFEHPGDFNFRRDLGDLLTAQGDNIFLIKISYRWNI